MDLLRELFHPYKRIKKVRFEACTMCQLKCVSCDTANGESRRNAVGWGYLQAAAFQKFVAQNPSIKIIELSNWGEIFLNPEIAEIFRIGYEHGLELTVGNGANLNNVKPEVLEALVKYRARYISVSLDGASQETYVQYRRGGNFDRVLANLKILNEFKRQYNSPYPQLGWQFIVFGHNEHELAKARALAEELNMEFKPKLNAHEENSPLHNPEAVRRELGLKYISRAEQEQKTGRFRALACHQLWQQPQINWDGKLLGCCQNIWGDFGNVLETPLKDLLVSKKYVYAKKILLAAPEARNRPLQYDLPCARCVFFHRLKSLRLGTFKK
ncbi:MAG: radical SAM protein [Candidatus Margulisbacteria bacterium]|jgi:MoaA/NifB/PqqE/SkfB family radical SAM enzyme|nr:radical SAM protein [Candidatus Margulisiibacteriota bacterium]